MKKINYSYVDTGGNPTVLVTDNILRKNQVQISKKIIKNIPKTEQVGYVERAKNSKALCRLQMAGGEFCGNAARALGVFLATIDDSRQNYIFESSGAKKLVSTLIKSNLRGTATFSELKFIFGKPKSKNIILKFGGNTINCKSFDILDIEQIIIDDSYYSKNFDYLSYFRKLYCNNIISSKACGFIFYSKLSEGKYRIIPVIYVKALDTIVTETSCASGSIALALFLKKDMLIVRQPSNYLLRVSLKGCMVIVGGNVRQIRFGALNV